MPGGAIKAGEAFIKMVLYDDALKMGLAKTKLAMQRFGNSLQSIGRGAALFAAPIVAGLGSTVKAAADTEEWMNRFRVIFGDMSNDAEKFADTLASAIGRSAIEIKNQMSTLQTFFVGMDFTPEKAREMSQTLTGLTYDLASFQNVADEDAARAMLSGISGEMEPLKRFGIVLSEASVKMKLMEMGFKGIASQAPQSAKAIARLEIIKDVMGRQGAIGDAARTIGSFTNQLKRLGAMTFEARAKIGEALIPELTKLVQLLGSAAEGMKKFSERLQASGSSMVDLAVIFGTAAAAAWGLGKAITFVGVAMNLLAAGPIAKIAAAVGIAVAAMTDWSDVIKEVKSALSGLAQTMETGQWELVGRQIGIAIKIGLNESMKDVGKNIEELAKSNWAFWPGALEEGTFFGQWAQRKAQANIDSLQAQRKELQDQVSALKQLSDEIQRLANSQVYQNMVKPGTMKGFWLQGLPRTGFPLVPGRVKLGPKKLPTDEATKAATLEAKAANEARLSHIVIRRLSIEIGNVWRETMSKLRWAWKDLADEMEKFKEGLDVFAETRTPVENAMKRLERLVELLRSGAISQDVFDRAVKILKDQLTAELQLPDAGGFTREGLLGGARAEQVFTEQTQRIQERQLEELIKLRIQAEKAGLINPQPAFS